MNRLAILCVDDEAEVRDALVRDLEPFSILCRIEVADDAEDAQQAAAMCADSGDLVGLILCDHLMPGMLGADLLVKFKQDPRFAPARKVLVTGQAGLQDTIKAVNDAGLHHYIAKPWTREDLHKVIRQYLTDYVIEECENLLPFVSLLDGPRLLEAQKRRNQCE